MAARRGPEKIASIRRPLWPWLAATALPASIIGAAVWRNVVDVPFWDDWIRITETFVRSREGSLDLAGLVAFHMERRPFFPRLWQLVTALPTEGSFPPVLAGTFALACLASFLLFMLLRRTTGLSDRELAGVSFLGNLLVFSPRQSENWVWASTFDYFIPVCCLLGSILLLREGRGRPGRAAAAGLLCLVATFSHSNGMLLWVIVAPFVVAAAGLGPALVWIGAGAFSLGLYFRGFTGSVGLGQTLAQPLRPVVLGKYLLGFLGNHVGHTRLHLSMAIGAAIVAAFVGAFVVASRELLRNRRRPDLFCWIAVAAYPLLSGAAAAAGRARFGLEQALAHRYLTFSLYLPIAIAGLLLVLWAPAGEERRRWPSARAVTAVLAVSFLALQSVVWYQGLEGVVWVGRMLRYGKSCLHFLKTAPSDACLNAWVYPDRGPLLDFAARLDAAGGLHPRLARTAALEDRSLPGSEPAGVFESLAVVNGKLVASGWGGLPDGKGRASAVILAKRTEEGAWVPVGFEPPMGPRPDVEKERGAGWASSGWVHFFDKDPAPPPGATLSAWAFDADRGDAFQLRGLHPVPPAR